MNVVPAHVYMVLVLIMLTATLILVMMATLEPIVKQVCIVNVILIEIRLFCAYSNTSFLSVVKVYDVICNLKLIYYIGN